jgi:hypothetical protein
LPFRLNTLQQQADNEHRSIRANLNEKASITSLTSISNTVSGLQTATSTHELNLKRLAESISK